MIAPHAAASATESAPTSARRAKALDAGPQRFANALTGVFTLLLLAVVIGPLLGIASDPGGFYSRAPVAALTFALLGRILVVRQVRNPIGWLFIAIGLSNALEVIGSIFTSQRLLVWVSQWSFVLGWGLLPLALLFFPDGRLPSRWWRAFIWFAAAGLGVAVGLLAFAAWHAPSLGIDEELTLSGRTLVVLQASLIAGAFVILASSAAALVSLGMRWRRADGDTRQQLKWLAAGVAVFPVGMVLETADVPGAWVITATAVPLGAAVAILKYRLYDIDLLLNRSLVYATLTLLVVGAYAGMVILLGEVLSTRTRFGPELVATGVVAVMFGPLRDRLQRGANRLLYGDRDQPYEVVSRLGHSLEQAVDPTAVLPRVAQTVAEALQLPYAAVELTAGEGSPRLVASYGRRLVEPEKFPMTYQGQVVGHLLVSPRGAIQAFTTAERDLLHNLALQAGLAAHAVMLTADLQRSRERLVRSREEERRRLRRDLHDGLGPSLAGMTMQVGAARALLATDVAQASTALGELERELQACVTEVRRVVDDLRPPALDQVGLARAIRQRTLAFSAAARGPEIAVSAPSDLPELPAAVEVAAYRIATEAVTNTVRHAGATRCDVTLTLASGLVVEIVDDGIGLTEQHRAGVGLRSMRERAEELGGTLTAQGQPGRGTRIRAELPLDGQ